MKYLSKRRFRQCVPPSSLISNGKKSSKIVTYRNIIMSARLCTWQEKAWNRKCVTNFEMLLKNSCQFLFFFSSFEKCTGSVLHFFCAYSLYIQFLLNIWTACFHSLVYFSPLLWTAFCIVIFLMLWLHTCIFNLNLDCVFIFVFLLH